MKNLIAFFEIPVTYFYQSVNFYQTILGVELMVAEYNNEKMACFVQDGQTVGTISYAPNFKPSEHGVLIQADGKWYFAVFADPAGNHIGLYTD